jgi:hypothetical protein
VEILGAVPEEAFVGAIAEAFRPASPGGSAHGGRPGV